jgi:phenylacetate-CoA ligase
VTRAGEYWDERVEVMSRDEVETMQLERLQSQLRRCLADSPFYRERLPDARDVTLETLTELPVITKDELREEQATHPPFGRFAVASRDSWREVHPSTGTTGAPVNTIWSRNDVASITDMTARTMWQVGVRPGDVVQNAFAYGLWVAGLSVHYASAAIGALVVPLGASVPTQKQLHYLHAGSTVLFSTPSYALHIAEELAREGTEVSELALRVGCFGGEAGAENPSTRGVIETGLGIDAYDYYGLAEIGPTFASECSAKSGLHIAEDHVLVECIDPSTLRPVAEGELGVLVLTHLTREATPMIRYWTNDYARLIRAGCECGRTHMRAAGGILGRHDDLVVFKGAKFYPSQVERVVRSFAELSPEFVVEIERERGGSRIARCTVVAEWRDGPVSDLNERLAAELRAELGVTPGLRVEPAGTLGRTSFKAIRLVERASA